MIEKNKLLSLELLIDNELEELIKGFLTSLVKTKVAFDRVREVAQQKGVSDNQLIDLLRYFAQQMKVPKATLFRWLKPLRSNNEESQMRLIDYNILPEDIQVFTGDFVEESIRVKNDSVDLIFTDPPYGKEAIPIYGRLAEVASRVLKDGGSLVAYAGQYTLPEVLDELRKTGLQYYWTLCIHHPGNKSRAHQREIFIDWKPLLWFVKGDKANVVNEGFSDYMESKRDKEDFEWQQDADNAEYVISKLTEPSHLVFDPMLGVGTTGIAACKLNRRFTGIEKDHDRSVVAKRKISIEFESRKNRNQGSRTFS